MKRTRPIGILSRSWPSLAQPELRHKKAQTLKFIHRDQPIIVLRGLRRPQLGLERVPRLRLNRTVPSRTVRSVRFPQNFPLDMY